MNQLRPELEVLPARMQNLPIDDRGYPVPWFVPKLSDGTYEFRGMDPHKWAAAVKFDQCWVCGQRLGRHKTFVAGCMCGINLTSSEPPSHLECARWSARNCPFLNNPDQQRRSGGEFHPDGKFVGGIAIQRNPGVTVLWTTRDFTVYPDGHGGKLIQMGAPESVEFWTQGRIATREEIDASIAAGLPNLEQAALREDDGLKWLNEAKERFFKLLPPRTGVPSPMEFVKLVARMTTESEYGEDAPPSEDWISTLNNLIVEARKIAS
jgi:hypothetical protein